MSSSFSFKRDAIDALVNLARPYDIMSEFVTQMNSVFTLNCTQKFEYVESKQTKINSEGVSFKFRSPPAIPTIFLGVFVRPCRNSTT